MVLLDPEQLAKCSQFSLDLWLGVLLDIKGHYGFRYFFLVFKQKSSTVTKLSFLSFLFLRLLQDKAQPFDFIINVKGNRVTVLDYKGKRTRSEAVEYSEFTLLNLFVVLKPDEATDIVDPDLLEVNFNLTVFVLHLGECDSFGVVVRIKDAFSSECFGFLNE